MRADGTVGKAEPELLAVASAVRQCTGLALASGSGSMASLRRALAGAGASTSVSDAGTIDDATVEFDSLVAELTVGETYFLRESAQLEFIAGEIFPALARSSRTKPVMAWSAGCATGEEAYSVAMLADEHQVGGRVKVIGTDVARHRLAVARKGVYGKWSFRGVAEPIVKRHFHQRGSLYSVAESLRSAVTFRYLNLRSSDWRGSGVHPASMDLILCRNVLIYLDRETVARVAAGLLEALAPDGWLLLGASDPPLADLVDCNVVVTESGLAYRRSSRVGRVRSTSARSPAVVSPRAPTAEPSPLRSPAGMMRRNARTIPAGLPGRSDGHQQGKAPDGLIATRLYRERRYEEACSVARDIVSRNPGMVDGWVVLVRGLSNLGRLEEAGIACAAAVDLHRTSAELAYMHAVLLRAAAQTVEASNALRRALYLDPQMAVAHMALGDVFASHGEIAGAARSYVNAERILARQAPGTVVDASDGHTAQYLAGIASLKRTLLTRSRSHDR